MLRRDSLGDGGEGRLGFGQLAVEPQGVAADRLGVRPLLIFLGDRCAGELLERVGGADLLRAQVSGVERERAALVGAEAAVCGERVRGPCGGLERMGLDGDPQQVEPRGAQIRGRADRDEDVGGALESAGQLRAVEHRERQAVHQEARRAGHQALEVREVGGAAVPLEPVRLEEVAKTPGDLDVGRALRGHERVAGLQMELGDQLRVVDSRSNSAASSSAASVICTTA